MRYVQISLTRNITEVETKLAAAMLKGEVKEGDTVKLRYDGSSQTVILDQVKEPVKEERTSVKV